MILSGHQPAYLPWLGYFDKMHKADLFVILDDVQFGKGEFINRVQIQSDNEEANWLTIPLAMEGYLHKTILGMEVAEPWMESHDGKLRAAYRKSPHWHEWYPKWRAWMEMSEDLLEACAFTIAIARDLGITTPVAYQSQRGIKGHKLELIVNLCRAYGADAFLFGTEGYDAYGKALAEHGITPLRQEFSVPEDPPLSVMHHLLREGGDAVRGMLCA